MRIKADTEQIISELNLNSIACLVVAERTTNDYKSVQNTQSLNNYMEHQLYNVLDGIDFMFRINTK